MLVALKVGRLLDALISIKVQSCVEGWQKLETAPGRSPGSYITFP